MIDDVPETGSIFVTTPHGETPEASELEQAAKTSYYRAFRARDACTQVGSCLVKIEHLEERADDARFDVDEYRLACDSTDCSLMTLLSQSS